MLRCEASINITLDTTQFDNSVCDIVMSSYGFHKSPDMRVMEIKIHAPTSIGEGFTQAWGAVL